MSELLASVWLISQDYEVFAVFTLMGSLISWHTKTADSCSVDIKTRGKHHKQHHKILSERQIKAGVRLLTVNSDTGECTLHPPKVSGVP